MEPPLQQFEEEARPTGVLRKGGQILRCFAESRWQLPLGAAGVLTAGALVMWVAVKLYILTGEASRWIEAIFDIGSALFLVGVLGGLLVPFWIVIMTLVWIHREDLWEAICCWAASAAAAVIAYFVAVLLACVLPHYTNHAQDADSIPPGQESETEI